MNSNKVNIQLLPGIYKSCLLIYHVPLYCFAESFQRVRKMLSSTRLNVMTSLGTTCLIWLLICILAPHVGALEVYSDIQCQDLCLRNNSCRTYSTGPIQANGKMTCNFNVSSGKPLELAVSILYDDS